MRYGPVTGATPTWWSSMQENTWSVDIDANRSIECFTHYRPAMAIDENNNFTKCIQSGPGWGNGSISNSFFIDGLYGADGSVISPPLTLNVTASERALFLRNGVTEKGASIECIGPFSNNAIPSNPDCEWENLFSTRFNEFSSSNATSSITTVRVSQTVDNATWIMTEDFVAFLNFTKYTFDPFIFSNPTQLVALPDPPTTGIPFPVHPAWFFAA